MLFTKAVEIVDAVRKRGLTLRLNGESVVQWAIEQRKQLLPFLGAILILVAVIGYWINRSGTSTKDFYASEQIFQQWLNSPGGEGRILATQELKKHLQDIPDLQTTYAAPLFQSKLLFPESQSEIPNSWVQNILRRAHGTSSYYRKFSQHALLISEGKYREALAGAITLLDDLNKDEAFWKSQGSLVRFGSVLYGMNLLRIASLERELGMKEEEKKTLAEVESFLHSSSITFASKHQNPESSALITQSLRDGNVTIFDYIESRKK